MSSIEKLLDTINNTMEILTDTSKTQGETTRALVNAMNKLTDNLQRVIKIVGKHEKHLNILHEEIAELKKWKDKSIPH